GCGISGPGRGVTSGARVACQGGHLRSLDSGGLEPFIGAGRDEVGHATSEDHREGHHDDADLAPALLLLHDRSNAELWLLPLPRGRAEVGKVLPWLLLLHRVWHGSAS